MASSSTSTTQRQSTSNHSGLGESEDDFEDAMSEPAHMEDDDDDIFDPANLGSASSKRLQPLIPGRSFNRCSLCPWLIPDIF